MATILQASLSGVCTTNSPTQTTTTCIDPLTAIYSDYYTIDPLTVSTQTTIDPLTVISFDDAVPAIHALFRVKTRLC